LIEAEKAIQSLKGEIIEDAKLCEVSQSWMALIVMGVG
jgi:hypothetical protein